MKIQGGQFDHRRPIGKAVLLATCLLLTTSSTAAEGQPTLGPFHPGIASWGGGDADGASGNYWWFDQAEPVWPHRTFPQPHVMHASWWELASDTGATKYKSASTPCEWPLKDSIWFFGTWYVPGTDRLDISPDGWVSFTSGATPRPEPPPAFPNAAQPNAAIAPFWADWNPLGGTGAPEPNCVYYRYVYHTLIVEWYRVTQVGKTTPFTFQLQLSFGGKSCLYSSLSFSYHFIDFLYSADPAAFPDYDKSTWPAQYLAGVENQTGTKGISVFADDLSYRPGRGYAIRCYYKKVFRYDVMAWDILSPGSVLLRYTKIEPKVVIANVGREIADFNLVLRIDSGARTVYTATRPVTRLHHMDNSDGMPWQDTIALPCWDRPGDLRTGYSMHLTTSYPADLDDANDTLVRTTSVGTGDEPKWPWHERTGGRASGNGNERLATAFPLNGGALVEGIHCEFGPGELLGGYMRLEVWSARNGCGLPDRLVGHTNDIWPGG